MHPADIKAAIKKAGSSQTAIANDLKVSFTAVYLVIEGQSQSERIARAISKITKIPVRDLWPGKYQDKAA